MINGNHDNHDTTTTTTTTTHNSNTTHDNSDNRIDTAGRPPEGAAAPRRPGAWTTGARSRRGGRHITVHIIGDTLKGGRSCIYNISPSTFPSGVRERHAEGARPPRRRRYVSVTFGLLSQSRSRRGGRHIQHITHN